MDRADGFPRTVLDICQEDDIDILVGVVTKHRAHAGVVALFLCEHGLSIIGFLYPRKRVPHRKVCFLHKRHRDFHYRNYFVYVFVAVNTNFILAQRSG